MDFVVFNADQVLPWLKQAQLFVQDVSELIDHGLSSRDRDEG